jgi:hypothetical protein
MQSRKKKVWQENKNGLSGFRKFFEGGMGNPGTPYPPIDQPTQGGKTLNAGCGGGPGPCPAKPADINIKLDNAGCLGGSGRCGPIDNKLDNKGCGGGPGPCPPVPKGCSGGPCPNTPAAGTAVNTAPTNQNPQGPMQGDVGKNGSNFNKAAEDSGTNKYGGKTSSPN